MLAVNISLVRCLKQSCVSRRALVGMTTRCVASNAPLESSTSEGAPETSTSTGTALPRASNPIRFHRKFQKKAVSSPLSREEVREAQETSAEDGVHAPPRASNPVHFRRKNVQKNAVASPPKPRASDPGTKLPLSDIKANLKNGTAKRPARKPRKQNSVKSQQQQHQLTSSAWVKISNIPILSTLDDMVWSINAVLDVEKERGIVDLDLSHEWHHDGPLPLIEIDEQPWVLSAKLVLSTRYRPFGWKIQFANRSIAHALLQRTRTTALCCAWKPVTVEEYFPSEKDDLDEELRISDATVRVENCSPQMTVDYVRHIFRRYDMSLQPPAIVKLERCKLGRSFKNDAVFLVNFEDASWARAAVRELQSVNIHNRELLLCQYPKQM